MHGPVYVCVCSLGQWVTEAVTTYLLTMCVGVQQWNTCSTTFKDDIIHTTTSGQLCRRQRMPTASHLWQQRVVVFHPNSWIRRESLLLTTMVSWTRMCIEYWCAFSEWFRFLLAAAAVTVRVFTRTWTIDYIHSRICSMWFNTFGATCAIDSLRGWKLCFRPA